jgi:4-amino-4-deoxy-L-arabinose transferase-like glycosyltransferase
MSGPVSVRIARLLERLERISDGGFLFAAVGSAFVIRMVWVLAIRPDAVSDFAFYYEHASTLAQGDGYTTDGVPTAYWPVGYPAFLAAVFWVCGPSVVAAGTANALLSAATLWCVHAFGREAVSPIAARVACILLALFPSQIGYCSLVSDSVLFTFLLWAGAACLARPTAFPRSLLGGIVFGLATLVRPYAFLVPLILLVWRGATWRARLRSALLVYAAAIAVLVPWTLRNQQALGKTVVVSTNGGINLYIGHNPRASGAYDDAGLSDLLLTGTEVERDEQARRAALAYIREHPTRAITIIPKKLAHTLAEDADALRWNIKGVRTVESGHYTSSELLGMGIFSGYYYVVVVAAIAYALRRKKRRVAVDRRVVGLVAYFIAIAAVFFGSSRFHFPIVPALALYAAAWICSVGQNDR